MAKHVDDRAQYKNVCHKKKCGEEEQEKSIKQLASSSFAIYTSAMKRGGGGHSMAILRAFNTIMNLHQLSQYVREIMIESATYNNVARHIEDNFMMFAKLILEIYGKKLLCLSLSVRTTTIKAD